MVATYLVDRAHYLDAARRPYAPSQEEGTLHPSRSFGRSGWSASAEASAAEIPKNRTSVEAARAASSELSPSEHTATRHDASRFGETRTMALSRLHGGNNDVAALLSAGIESGSIGGTSARLQRSSVTSSNVSFAEKPRARA